MNKISRICHLADIHIRKTPTRNAEYQQVFKRLITSLKKEKPDRIVIVGDLVHDYLDLQGEQLIMAHSLLLDLAAIAPVRITRGNHDCRKSNLKRVDSIRALVETCDGADIKYYDKTGFEVDDDVMWSIWHHGEKNNNPWKTKEGKKIDAYRSQSGYTHINLFHDPITGCRSTTDFEMKSSAYYKVSDFNGDISMFGDIHKFQYLDKEQTKAYCGSLIEQNITEGDGAFHGYLMWDIESRTAKQIPIKSDHTHHNIKLTPYTDFEDLDFEIENPTKEMTVRFVWGTLPQARTKENQRLVVEHLKSQYKNIKIQHKNEFVEDETVEINENVTLENVTDKAVQQEIFKEYLEKIGSEDNVIADVLALDEEVLNEIDIPEDLNIEWDVIKFGGNNFMSYEKLDIDWRKFDGLFQISGENTAGKTTILKIISYILYNKTLETENRVKYGDSRFINNRNGANFCDAYMVLESGGEYFGIKRKTEIKRNKAGEINGAPTTLSYYILDNPDDEMTDDNILEKLDGDRRQKTQEKINAIVGSYDNFMRIVMTTSDTLNLILSNDMAVFIDSLLYDSGLDIFDKKLEGWKIINKRKNEKTRVSCNVEMVTLQNTTLNTEINELKQKISGIEVTELPEVQGKIKKGREYQESLIKKLYQIDPEIYNLDVDEARLDISDHRKKIVEIKARKMVLQQSINALRESYDEPRLIELIEKRDNHKTFVYEKKFGIKEEERKIAVWEHEIEIINGRIFILTRDGKKLRDDVKELKESKTCPTCGQPMTADHQEHIEASIKVKEVEMYKMSDDIKKLLAGIEVTQRLAIQDSRDEIVMIKGLIEKADLEMETVLSEIGTLNNEKNDVDRRNTLQIELDLVPTKIENEQLNIDILEQKITRHENSLKQIEENKRIEEGIEAAKKRIGELELEETDLKEDVFIRKSNVGEKQKMIVDNNSLITDFKAQEYNDMVMGLYKKCVHRDGIPRQMLSNHIIPRINLTLDNILSIADFKIWLDPDDLRPKLAYNSRPNAIIDCIGSSGKERSFSSVVLKFGLNQINVKAKPSIFLLDEVMNKLDPNAVDEFKEILQLIKVNMKKVLVIEHSHEINPDYLINVQLDENDISTLTLT